MRESSGNEEQYMKDGVVLMTERIPENIINEIREAIDIVDVVSEYVQLKKQGRNFFGLCPFHGENTPSFSVSPEKQIYHCFGCGAGGNVFKFIMDIEGVPFQEAVIKLAAKANIKLNLETNLLQRETVPKEHEQMIEAHEFLRRFYHHLLVHTKEGQEAFEYLLKRGFTKEIIEEFQIGYALNSRNIALNLLIKKGFDLKLLEKSGLIVKNEENGTYFDRFRDRIMFPIYDHKGNTVAFSGRALHEENPKYLNSPETVIFHKSKILFNFHRARPHIRKKQTAVLFEGFADCIAAYMAGVENGIATMGTALTEEHINLIKRNTDLVILCFDGDQAGEAATIKAGEMLREVGCQVQVAVIPENMDPNEYILVYGPSKFQHEIIDGSMTFMSFKMNYLRKGKNLQNEGDRLRYIEQVQEELCSVENAVERDLYLRQLADEFSLSFDALKMNQRRIYFEMKKKRTESGSAIKKTVVNLEKKLMPAHYNAERILIAHMLKDIQIALKVQKQMNEHSFTVDEHQAIVTYLYAFYEEGNLPNLSHFLTFLPDEHLQKIAAEIGMMMINEEITDQELNDYINSVLKYQKLLKIKEKEKESKQAELEHDYKKAAQIAMEILQLRKML